MKQMKRKTLTRAIARTFIVSTVTMSMISLPVGAAGATYGSSSNASNPGIILSSGTTTVNGGSDVWEPNPQAQNGAVQFNGGNLAFDYMGQTPANQGTVKQANGSTYSTTPPLGMMPVGPYVYIPMDTVTMYQDGTLSTEDGAAYDDVFQFAGSNPVTNAFGTLTMDNVGSGQMSADFVGTQPLAADGLVMDNGMNLVFGNGSTPTSETLFDIQANNQPNFWLDNATVSALATSAVADTSVSPGLQFFMENGAVYDTGSLNVTPGGTGYNTDAMVAGTGTFAASDVNLSGNAGGGLNGVLAFEGDNSYLSTFPATGKLTAYLSQGALGSLFAEDATVYLENNGGSNNFTGNVGFGANATMHASGEIQGSMQMNQASDSLYIANSNLESQYDTGINTFDGLTLSGSYVQTDGSLYIPISPTKAWGLTTGGNYAITGGNVIVSGETGNYTNGAKYMLIQSNSSTGSNTFAPKNVYYVYNGANSSTIGGLNPYLKTTTTQVDLCLGSSCIPAPAKAQPAPAQPSQPSQPAKAQPAPSQPVIPVHVVTPVQEAKPIVADSAGVTQAAIQNTAQTLVSTGVVGGGPRGIWLKTLGGFSNQGGYQGMNYGLLSGYGWSVGPDGRSDVRRDVAGVAFSAGQAVLGTGSQDFTKTKASDYGLWAYGTYYPLANRSWKITGTLGGGLSQNTLMSTALGLPQVATFGGSFVGTEIRASYWRTLDDGIIVSPRLSVGYNQSWTGGYVTHGGGPLDVQVSGQSDGQLYLSPAILVGKKFDYRSQSGNHTIFPQIRLGAVENIGPNPAAEISSGQVAGQVQGLAYPHTQGMVEARLDVISHTPFSKGLSANVSARQLFGGGASSTEFVAAVKYHW
ncbi:autotransporter outer membrane beta-barrel domain-containing protein [Acidithiobacillus ferrianus]|uniref:Autotransporter domain-containing protein n=2 Tax=Acidithiobacillus ferrianus TaxID=2678518 RepID=A0A845U919_9PROT|nr:autotransporter outer membrane beta-barrel domain-containing protein [Acidithiobacillus ferrianus]NDU43343.1 hypothetical protein [Acidithiobacillus ferrianus]